MQEKILFKQAYVTHIRYSNLSIAQTLIKCSAFCLLWLSRDPGCAAIFNVRTSEDLLKIVLPLSEGFF